MSPILVETSGTASQSRGPMRHFPGVVTLQRWVPELVDGFMELDPTVLASQHLGDSRTLGTLGLGHFHEHMLFLGADTLFLRSLQRMSQQVRRNIPRRTSTVWPLRSFDSADSAPGPRTLGRPGPGRYLSEHGGDSNAPGIHRNGSLAAMFVLGWQLCAPEVHHVRIYHLLLQGPLV